MEGTQNQERVLGSGTWYFSTRTFTELEEKESK